MVVGVSATKKMKTPRAWGIEMAQAKLHLRIEYDHEYKAIVLAESGGNIVRKWASGDPQKDWADYIGYAKEHTILVLESSSVTHFLWDVPGWRMIIKDGHEMIVPEDCQEWDDHVVMKK